MASIPMFRRIIILMLLIMGIVFSATALKAQSSLIDPSQELRYIRQVTENQAESIGLSASTRQVYALPQSPNCWAISRNGTYVALSSLGEPITLTIQQISSSEIILQTDWLPNWRPCSMIWLTDTSIGMARSDVSNAGLIYEVASGTLTEIDYIPGQPLPLPTLPEQLQVSAMPQFVLPSPQPNIFLYQRCVRQSFTQAGQQLCPGGIKAVIYNATTRTFLAELERAATNISGYEPVLERPSGYLGAAWSADGRFLAYRYVPEGMYQAFDLAIRDLEMNQNLNLDFPNEYVAYNVSMRWSPTGHKLLFWLHGRFGEDEISDNYDTTRHPIIFDADQQQFVAADRPYEFPVDYDSNPVQWSADGQGLVFTDGSKNLIYLNPQTGVTTLLDTNVSKVFDWVEVSPVQSTPTSMSTVTASDKPIP